MKHSGHLQKTIRHPLALAIAVATLVQCKPREQPGQESEALQASLDAVRDERDSLLEKLDASTRERVDLDGEINRLRQELEALKVKNATSSPATN